ncbi:MAG: DUF3365 domain-containing protein [Proteobacteria bacterium]|nr:DUF3365 domain-containing protein [Pseudomonadota bacterium]
MKTSIAGLFLIAVVAYPVMGDSLDDTASVLVQRFGSQLKPALLQAMSAGGPTQAIPVCAEKAPAISRALSEESGWHITRVSLKARNPTAVPDTFERQVLEDFRQRSQAGETPGQLKHSESVDGQFRYMQAQLTEGICLTCHGTEIESGLKDMISAKYPNDQATGFLLGDVRGAISLTLPLTSDD